MRIALAMIAGWCASCAQARNKRRRSQTSSCRHDRLSPRLIELDADVRAAQGHARQAGAWPIPTVGLEREDFGGTGPYRGSANAQTTLSISEPLELGGQRRARREAGDALVVAAQARHAQRRAELGYDLAVAYATAEATQARIELLTEDLGRAREDVRSARALVEAGKEGELRAVQAEAAASAAEADLEAARADSIEALAHLSTLAGVTESYSGVAPSLLNRSLPRRTTAAAPPPTNAPTVATAEAERTSAARRVVVEEKRLIPTPAFSVGRRRIAGDDADVWVAGISIPVPIFNRNRGDLAGARAELDAAEARLAGARLEADAASRIADVQAAAASARLTASSQGEASAREAYRLARIGYDAGRTPLFELQGARRALTEAQLRSLDARLTGVLAEASLARLAGRIPFIE